MDSVTRKEHLILTAIEIIDELGYQGLTTKELSKRQDISEAALYRHFKSKNEIVAGVLDYYTNVFDGVRELIKTKNLSALKAIEFYISKFMEMYENYPAMISILNSYEVLSHEKEISNTISEIVSIRHKFLTELFQKGIDNKEFDGMVSAEALSYIMIGTIASVTLTWKFQNYDFSLTDKIRLITNQVKAKIIMA